MKKRTNCDFSNAFQKGTFTGATDSEGEKINVGDFMEDVLNTGKTGIVKFGLYYNCFDRKEVKQFGGHVGFYVEFDEIKTRKDLFYWAKNSKVVPNGYID